MSDSKQSRTSHKFRSHRYIVCIAICFFPLAARAENGFMNDDELSMAILVAIKSMPFAVGLSGPSFGALLLLRKRFPSEPRRSAMTLCFPWLRAQANVSRAAARAK